MQGRKNYQEKLFMNFQLSDRVPADNLYRKILEVLDFQFLYKSTASYYGKEGQASIDPVVFFKLMLVGYLENLCSDRRIIQTASMRMDILFFIGYDIDETLPWHSTLSRTRQLYGEDVFQELFKQVLKQCITKGMLSGKRQAIDSVFIKANASMDSLVEKEIMEDASAYGKELEANQDLPILIDEKKTQKGRNNRTHYSKADPDARISMKPGKPTRLNYLGQVSVDTESHFITHVEAFHADNKDSQCLNQVITTVQNNLSENNLNVEEILADGNYSSSEALLALEENNVMGYIPNFGGYKPIREEFVFDSIHNHYICSQGKLLEFKRFKTTHAMNVKREYASSGADCRLCPIKISCIGNARYKTLSDSITKHLYDRMHQRVNSTKGVQMKKLRQSTVEPVIGTLVTYMGLRKINTKGLKSATKCMTMSAIAYNLKKLIKVLINRRIPFSNKPSFYCSIDLIMIYKINFEHRSIFKNYQGSKIKLIL